MYAIQTFLLANLTAVTHEEKGTQVRMALEQRQDEERPFIT